MASLFPEDDLTVVQVLVPLPLAGPYDYTVPQGAALTRGQAVCVPLGPREVVGIVWGEARAEVAAAKLKPVRAVLDAPALPLQLCDFVDWVAEYTVSPPGAVLAMALRSAGLGEPLRTVKRVGVGAQQPDRMTPARARVLETVQGDFLGTPADLAREAGVSSGVVKGLIDAGALTVTQSVAAQTYDVPDGMRPGKALSDLQRAAAARLRKTVSQAEYQTLLLDGVTGSGKTEVYFEAVAEAIAIGRQVLILLPEIALTIQFLERFTARFGCPPAQWHSDLAAKDRRHIWAGVASGAVKVVVGARSALFLPYADLGLIVVDEEHESAFKQEEGVTYHARDMAVVRARFAQCPVVLASATPSLESLTNAEQGRYERLVLPSRAGGAALPSVDLIDLKTDPPPERDRWLSPRLVSEIETALAQGEQALLFLNRRGYAPLVICRACGHRMTAPDTDSWLVEHRYQNRLVCHQTGFSMPRPTVCPACGEEDGLHSCGPGVERVAEEAKALFPAARQAVMSSDMITSPGQAQALINDMQEARIDLLVGTQMVAKGHNFPLLTVVGVVDADLGLSGGDLRAGERTYQLLHQVAGRAGRAERRGRVFLQTHMPEHAVMQALARGDREAFVAAESGAREAAGQPPFGRLAALVLSARENEALHAVARDLARAVPRADGVSVLGPAMAPIAMLRGRHRMRFLVKAERRVPIQAFVRQWLAAVKVPGKVRLSVDIDPYSFL